MIKTFDHNFKPVPFNPSYISYSADVMQIVIATLHKAGHYSTGMCDSELIKHSHTFLMCKGKPQPHEVKQAKDYLYNL